jgi:phthiodiolone/phenolphthiodiolone dimycocerosates ketoreductase
LGHLATRNRLGRLRLGIGVTDASRRNPAVTAQAAATLQLLTRGRAILGIGTRARESNERYGVGWSNPVVRFEEAIATIRTLWNSRGELVTRDSPFFPLHNIVFDLPPTAASGQTFGSPPTGLRMLRATGPLRRWVVSRHDVQAAAGLESVLGCSFGRWARPRSISAAGLFFVMTGRSRDEVDEALGSQPMKAFALNAPAENGPATGRVIRSVTTSPAHKTSSRRRSTNRPSCHLTVSPMLLKECLLTHIR